MCALLAKPSLFLSHYFLIGDVVSACEVTAVCETLAARQLEISRRTCLTAAHIYASISNPSVIRLVVDGFDFIDAESRDTIRFFLN